MKLLHVSDTHVGFAAYARVTPEGLNQREADFFGGFSRAVDVALRERADVVLHAGDLFDSVRPTNRAISHVLAEVRRLHASGIPFVAIAGNHEAPRLRETGAVMRLLDFVPGARAVYKGALETVRVGVGAQRDGSPDPSDYLAIHAAPHAPTQEALVAELRRAKPDPDARWNVAALHAGVVGVGDFRTGEFHEQVVPQNELPQGMDYVALGHHHRCTEVAERVWYAGSTERCSFREAGETKSVNLVDLARGSVTPVPLPARPMLDLPPLACGGMAEEAIAPALHERLASAPLDGAIARLRVDAIPAHVYATLDHRRIRAATAAALHFELQAEVLHRDSPGVGQDAMGRLSDEFDAFLARRVVMGSDREALLAEARGLLDAAEGAG